jgi:hypothetical protein
METSNLAIVSESTLMFKKPDAKVHSVAGGVKHDGWWYTEWYVEKGGTMASMLPHIKLLAETPDRPMIMFWSFNDFTTWGTKQTHSYESLGSPPTGFRNTLLEFCQVAKLFRSHIVVMPPEEEFWSIRDFAWFADNMQEVCEVFRDQGVMYTHEPAYWPGVRQCRDKNHAHFAWTEACRAQFKELIAKLHGFLNFLHPPSAWMADVIRRPRVLVPFSLSPLAPRGTVGRAAPGSPAAAVGSAAPGSTATAEEASLPALPSDTPPAGGRIPIGCP